MNKWKRILFIEIAEKIGGLRITALFMFGCLLVGGQPLMAATAPAGNVEAARKQVLDDLSLMSFRLQMFHHEARSSMKASLDLPLFREYFSLPESARNHYDELGIIKLTDQQHAVRKRLEEWILKLHSRFPIGETCLIDRDGQEHLRVVGGRIEKPVHFSHEEHGAPFFAASFQARNGEVYMSEPYMSSDSFSWVVAFTSPVVIDDQSKPAFYHFELPLQVLQHIIRTKDFGFNIHENATPDAHEEGRFFILDWRSGLLIADSKQEIDYNLFDERHPNKNDYLPDYVLSEKLSDYLPSVESISRAPQFLAAVEHVRVGEEAVVDLKIDGEDYVLALKPLEEHHWSVVHLDPVSGPGFWEKQ